MDNSVASIPLLHLLIAFLPVMAVTLILYRWQLPYQQSMYATFRMLIQLLLIGYCLTYIFEADQPWIVVAILAVMLFSSSWIALRTIDIPRQTLYLKTCLAILIGGGLTLIITTQMVLLLRPWYYPQYMIPLAGMIFANCMNSISLAAERLNNEIQHGQCYQQARGIALQTALIPITNSLLAVGLVSLPGMMTGQILSGVSPLIAVRYQIMVMCMLFGSAGMATACFLWLVKPHFNK